MNFDANTTTAQELRTTENGHLPDLSAHQQPPVATKTAQVEYSKAAALLFDVASFKSLYKPEATFEKLTFEQLCARLTTHDIRQNKDGELFSLAIYKDGTKTRANENVSHLCALIADCDESHTWEHIKTKCERLGYFAIAYSSHRNGIEATEGAAAPGQRYRVVFPLKNPVPVEQWPDVWERFNILFNGELDAACKDASRAYYLPSSPDLELATHQVFEGRLLSIDDLPELPKDFYQPRFESKFEAITLTGDGRPGDEYNAKASNEDTASILEKHNWFVRRSESGIWHARRPGKKGPGNSATIGFYGDGILHVFSSNAAPFEAGHSYKPFQVLALLEHGGDFSGAASALRKASPRNGYKGAVIINSTRNTANDDKSESHGNEAISLTLGLPLDDIGNGQRFATQHGHMVRWCNQWKCWLIWDGCRWVRDSKGEIERLAKITARLVIKEAELTENEDARAALLKHAAATFKRVKRETMLKDATSEPGISITTDELDTDSWSFNVLNGTVDLRTGQLQPHSSARLITKLASVLYDPNAKCPLFLDFVHKIFDGKDSLIDCAQRVFGYSLTGSTKEQSAIILHGAGSNGKTTLLQAIAKVMGEYALEIEPETIMVKKQERMAVDIADMFKVRFLITSESNDTQRLDEAKVKKMTGGEQLTGERKFEHPFKFWPEFKLFLATNHLPKINGTDHGIWRRIVPVPFDVKFWKEGEGNGPEHLKADLDLSEKLEAEYSGILNWLIEGCLKWQRDGLTWPEEVQAKKAAYREEQDILGPFLVDCCIVGESYTVTAKQLNAAYVKWCEDNGERPISQTMLGKRLGERGFINKPTKTARIWQGLGLKCDGSEADSSQKGVILGPKVTRFDEVTRCDAFSVEVSKNNSHEASLRKTCHNASPVENASPIEDLDSDPNGKELF